MREQMGDGDSPVISFGDASRGLSIDGRRLTEARPETSIGVDGVGVLGDVNGGWDVDPEVRALTEDERTRTRFVGDLGLEAEGMIVWAFRVGVSGGVDTSLSVLLVGVTAS